MNERDQENVRNLVDTSTVMLDMMESTCEHIKAADGRHPVYKHFFEILLYICTLDFEMRSLLLAWLTNPNAHIVWEKYLALNLLESRRRLFKELKKYEYEIMEVKDEIENRLDTNKVKTCFVQFRKAANLIASDPEIASALTLTRNAVAAHHGGTKDEDSLKPVTAWVMNAIDNKGRGWRSENSLVVKHCLDMINATGALGEQMLNAVRTN